jgi:hypothetical protein
VGEEVVRKGHGLRPLEVGVSGHDRVLELFGARNQYSEHCGGSSMEGHCRVLAPQSKICGDEVVPAPPRVNARARITRAGGEFPLHE